MSRGVPMRRSVSSWIHNMNFTDHLTNHYLDVFVTDFYPFNGKLFVLFTEEVSFNLISISRTARRRWIEPSVRAAPRETVGPQLQHAYELKWRTTYSSFQFSPSFNKDFLSTSWSIFSFIAVTCLLTSVINPLPLFVGFKAFLGHEEDPEWYRYFWGNLNRVEVYAFSEAVNSGSLIDWAAIVPTATNFNRITSQCQVDTVTVTADTMTSVTCKYRWIVTSFNTVLTISTRLVFCNQLIRTNDNCTSFWVRLIIFLV